MNDLLSLAAEFPATDAAEWRKLVDAALKGASFEKRLVSQTYDGLRIEPLYPRAAGAEPVAGRKAGAAWTITQRVDHPDPVAANAEALHDLENGATGISLIFAGSVGSYGYGLDGSEATIARALDNVWLDAIPIDTEFSAQAKDAGLNLAKAIKARGIDPAATQLRFGHDPLGLMARNGAAARQWSETSKLLAGMAGDLAAQGFKGPFAVADARAVHAAGGSEAQELAFAIANAIAYLRMFEDAGIARDAARKMIYFRLAADADEFLNLAKFRALRKLWAHVEKASGLTPKPAFVTAETAWRMMTARDPYVNMLRTTIAITAAGLGGADAVTVLPFSIARGLPDRFARRAARNQQLVLLEESNLFRVADPAAGSGAIEALTTQLAQSAWALVQEIEGAGGAPQAIEQGLLQKHVARVREARQASIARRKEALTGTSDYPNLTEAEVKVLNVKRVTVPPLTAAITFDALPLMRLSEPFEALRDKSDAALLKTGARPKVFLATLGKLADFTPRAMFAKSFYEAGGIEALGNDGFAVASPLPDGERSTPKASGEGKQSSPLRSNPSPAPSPSAPERPLPMGEVKTDIAEMIAAFKKSGATLACLCGSDAAYAEQAVTAAKALRDAGAVIHLAGRPGDLEATLKEAGVTSFSYMGCDVLAILQDSLKTI